MLSASELRVLVADGEPSTLRDYRLILEPGAEDTTTPLSQFEAELIGTINSPRQLPRIGLTTCDHKDAAVSVVLEATRSGRPFAIAFVDLQIAPGHHGLELLSTLRALDPALFIVIVTAAADFHPVDMATQVPPVDRLLFLRKPIYGAEIQQLVNALGGRWRSERLAGETSLAALQNLSRWPTELEAMLEELPAGIAVFDRNDRLIGRNRFLREMYPATADLEPGTAYEEMIRAMARDGIGEQPAGLEAWVRLRLDWHKTGTGAIEQRLKDQRSVLLLERRTSDGRCICLHVDVTAWLQQRGSPSSSLVLQAFRG